MINTPFGRLFVVSAFCWVFVAPASQALAHAELKTSTPAANAVLAASPTEITITFSEGIEARFSGLELTGPDGKSAQIGPVAVKGKEHETLVIPVTEALKTGRYTAKWHNLSTDGHKLKGAFSFSVK